MLQYLGALPYGAEYRPLDMAHDYHLTGPDAFPHYIVEDRCDAV